MSRLEEKVLYYGINENQSTRIGNQQTMGSEQKLYPKVEKWMKKQFLCFQNKGMQSTIATYDYAM